MAHANQSFGGHGRRREAAGEDLQRTGQIGGFGGDEIEQQGSLRGIGVHGGVPALEEQDAVDAARIEGLHRRWVRRMQSGGPRCGDEQPAQQGAIVQSGRYDPGQFSNQVNKHHGLRRPHATHDNPVDAIRQGQSPPKHSSGRSVARRDRLGVISVMTPSSVFTLPNIVSSSRVVLAVGFVATEVTTTRLALICIASLTDFLDGWIARRTKVTSRFGALLDPVADRFFVLDDRGMYKPKESVSIKGWIRQITHGKDGDVAPFNTSRAGTYIAYAGRHA